MAIWRIHGNGRTVEPGAIVAPDERLNWPATIGFGAQHVVAMFGATFLVPLLTGFPPATTLLFSGIGTLLFLVITGSRLPSYLGSSFAFIAPIVAAKAGHGPAAALFGVVVIGVLLAIVGVIVHLVGTRFIERLMPPVVAGTIVALIGFNLASAAKTNFDAAPLTAIVTLAATILSAVVFKGLLSRLSIFIGVVVGYLFAVVRGEVSFDAVASAPLVGLPDFTSPYADLARDPGGFLAVLPAFLPVVLVLIAENVGHIKGVGQMTGRPVERLTGRALIADGLSTVLAGSFGGSATTTYGENIGVMAATRVYSTATYWVAGIVAIVLSMSPKVGQIIFTIPPGVLGGITTALYGLIGIIGIKIWVDNRVDFGKPTAQFTAGTALIIAVANYTLTFGEIELNGIALGTIAALVVYHLMHAITRLRGGDTEDSLTSHAFTTSRPIAITTDQLATARPAEAPGSGAARGE